MEENKEKIPRERLFLSFCNVSAWEFAGINILHLFNLSKNQKGLHGGYFQKALFIIFRNTWTIGTDLLYTILNTYEKEKYLESNWQPSSDPNKRYIRYYRITEKGRLYLNKKKDELLNRVIIMDRYLKISLDLLWKNHIKQEKTSSSEIISTKIFLSINIFDYLYKNDGWIYGRQIKNDLVAHYKKIWTPSDGMLYPVLSEQEKEGYLSSIWGPNNGIETSKKRNVRKFRLTEKGKEHYLYMISPASGFKNKIIDLCEMSNGCVDFLSNSIPDMATLQGAVYDLYKRKSNFPW